jgi:hypothetical protein
MVNLGPIQTEVGGQQDGLSEEDVDCGHCD